MAKEKRETGIKSWSEQDRPREKLLEKGSQSLTDAELLAILIGSGPKGISAVDVGRELLNQVSNDLNALAKLSIPKLRAVKGIGKAKAITITAALELGRRRKHESGQNTVKIASSRDVYDLLLPYYMDMEKEKFIVILLNRANNVIRKVEVSSGGVTGTVVDPKIIFKAALDETASSIVLSHNHPSGSLKPSQSDIDLTRKIKNAASFFDITILDHVIFTNSSYFSFADEAML